MKCAVSQFLKNSECFAIHRERKTLNQPYSVAVSPEVGDRVNGEFGNPSGDELERDGEGDKNDNYPLQHFHSAIGSLVGYFFIDAF